MKQCKLFIFYNRYSHNKVIALGIEGYYLEIFSSAFATTAHYIDKDKEKIF